MANEQFWGRVGWLTLSTLDDARRSSITGTTLPGPNGSGQFAWVYTSTLNSLQVRLGSTSFAASTLCAVLGILENTPGPGDPADICISGVTKAIAGSTSIVMGTQLQQASTFPNLQLSVVPWQSGSGPPIGMALEAPTSTGAVFTILVNAVGQRST